LSEFFADLEQEYILNERRSLPHLKLRLKHLKQFATVRAADFTSRHIDQYTLGRKRNESSNTTIDRELQV